MTDLSETQTLILSTARAREDGLVFPTPSHLRGGPVGNCLKSLLKRGLIEEITASDLNTVWRHDEERGPITLRVTQLAHDSLGIVDDPEVVALASTTPVQRPKGTKQEMLITMLRAPDGATIAEITKATGWLAHYADLQIMPM
jgi:Protein of unknown function (DUF3489)